MISDSDFKEFYMNGREAEIDQIYTLLRTVATTVIQSVWSKNPSSFQLYSITRLLQMHCNGFSPETILLIQGTDSGKSTVPQTVGVTTCGLTLILENTLSLGSDQQYKYCIASQEQGTFSAIKID